ncbi:MAG: bifunctional DNA-formamidopyrimidine glycosylase/DNA-(apurinic or apyrimidinic site) lyase [Anaerolineales bacterium]
MPELPEVETIARSLRPELAGRTIYSTSLLWKRTLAFPSPEEFAAQIGGREITGVGRRAKYLHIQLADLHLFIHLRMSGDLYLRPLPCQPEKHDRIILELSDGRVLVFNDPRKFGRAWLTAHPEDVIGGLGPEPLDPAFTPQELHARLKQHRRQLKPLLLDQSFLAGLGNIYTDEALHLSGLHPLRISDTIHHEEARQLYHAIQTVLMAGIEHNGASIDWVYRGGDFQNYFRVYGREAEPCPRCGTPIERLIVGQRSTHICPQCQVK